MAGEVNDHLTTWPGRLCVNNNDDRYAIIIKFEPGGIIHGQSERRMHLSNDKAIIQVSASVWVIVYTEYIMHKRILNVVCSKLSSPIKGLAWLLLLLLPIIN